jgi:2-desacetyl-2-hydroxyethyl bacteriochlorophyllide A dehydrogenase
MKTVYLKEPGKVFVQEAEKPAFREGHALIKIKSMGICGSDIGAFRGANPIVKYPVILGHELAGVVEEISGENPRNVKKGDRVVIDPFIYCGKCYPCSIGRTNCCENLRTLGVHTDGGMAEYITHPAHLLVPIPDSLPWEFAPLAEPLAISLHGIHRAKLAAGGKMVINGAGAIGLLAAMAATVYGAEPILIDTVEERLAYAREVGVVHTICIPRQNALEEIRALTNGRMADVVMEASGAGPAIRACLDMAAFTGKIILTGWPKEETRLPTDFITRKELDVLGSRNSKGELEEALSMIAGGKIDAKAILSKLISLDEVPDAVRELSEYPGRYLKINAMA